MERKQNNGRLSMRLPRSLLRQLDRLASLSHLNRTNYIRVKLEEIAQRESLAATGGQS